MEEPRQPRRGPRLDKVGRGWWIGLAVVGAALLIIALWLYVRPDTATEKKDFIQAVGVLIAGLAGFVGLYFTWQNLKQTRENTEKQLRQARESTEKQLQQARESQERVQANAQETLRLTEQGQITERFTRAIDQLGATDDEGRKKLEIRLGGIYALERIDKESHERTYHSTVMEVLTAYVREHAPWPPNSSKSPERDFIKSPGDSASVSTSDETAEQDEGTEQGEEPAQRTPSTDIQAILEVLKRREEDHVPEKHRIRSLDLRETDLRGADLRGINLEGAILAGGHLEGATLDEASSLKSKFPFDSWLESNIGDDKTELPKYFVDHRPSVWSKSVEKQRKIMQEALKQEPKDE